MKNTEYISHFCFLTRHFLGSVYKYLHRVVAARLPGNPIRSIRRQIRIRDYKDLCDP